MSPIDAIAAMEKVVGADNISSNPTDLQQFAHDGTFVEHMPDFVVSPASTEEVSGVMAILYEHGIPITSRGAGTGLSGGAVPIQGGAVVSLDRLRKLEIDAPSLCAVAGAGVITGDLQNAASEMRLMYPPDPASFDICTIGGNIATNAGGPSCLKYGVTAEYVLGLTVVIPPGKVLRLGGKARKRSAGYRLAQLFIGSEGTLGIVTEAILRLIPQPAQRMAALAAFGSVDDAAATVTAILGEGHLPATLELMDHTSLEFVADLLPLGFPRDAASVLLIEQDGPDTASVQRDLEAILAIATTHGAYGLTQEVQAADRSAMWLARRSIGKRLTETRSYMFAEDVAVPIAKIPEMVKAIGSIAAETQVSIATFGHAGDGNLHPVLVFDDRDPKTLNKVADAASRTLRAALELGGTVSAEHGIGATKRGFAQHEIGEDALQVMQGIKNLLDAKGLLNPGKLFPSGTTSDKTFLDALPGWLD